MLEPEHQTFHSYNEMISLLTQGVDVFNERNFGASAPTSDRQMLDLYLPGPAYLAGQQSSFIKGASSYGPAEDYEFEDEDEIEMLSDDSDDGDDEEEDEEDDDDTITKASPPSMVYFKNEKAAHRELDDRGGRSACLFRTPSLSPASATSVSFGPPSSLAATEYMPFTGSSVPLLRENQLIDQGLIVSPDVAVGVMDNEEEWRKCLADELIRLMEEEDTEEGEDGEEMDDEDT